MSFASPWFFAALALLVPVVVTFLVRQQRHVLRVPSTLVWRLSARSVSKSRRFRDLRRLVALLACALAVLGLSFAAARPGGRHEGLAVYVVDLSASMAGDPLDDARRWLERDLAALGPRGRVAIVVAGNEARVALPPTPPGPTVDAIVRGLTAEAHANGTMDEALTLADALAGSSAERVIVLSDGPVDADRHPTSPFTVKTFGRRDVADNVGLVNLFTHVAEDGNEREAVVGLATSSKTSRRVRLRVTLRDMLLADRAIEIPAHGQLVERVVVPGAGRLTARVEADDGRSDALAIDDQLSLEEVEQKPPRVLLVHPESSPSADPADATPAMERTGGVTAFFLEKAIRATGVTELTVVPATANAPSASAVDVAIVVGDGPARPHHVPTFYVGGTAASPSDSFHPRRPVPRRFAFRYRQTQPTSASIGATPITNIRTVGKDEARFRSVALEDPLLRGVSLDGLTTLRAQVAEAPSSARVLVELDAGPTLLAGGKGQEAWVWLGLDPEASDLVLRVAFPVLVANVLAELGGATQIVHAEAIPRAEVALEAKTLAHTLPTASEPRWRLPVRPALLLAVLSAMLLAFEAWWSLGRTSRNPRTSGALS